MDLGPDWNKLVKEAGKRKHRGFGVPNILQEFPCPQCGESVTWSKRSAEGIDEERVFGMEPLRECDECGYVEKDLPDTPSPGVN